VRQHLRVTIDGVTPSLNKLLGMHWQARRKLRPQYAWAIKVAMIEAGWSAELEMWPELPPKMRVQITSHRKALLDKDNLVGGAKPLLDALKDVHAIRNDSPDWVTVEYLQVVDKAQKTVIDMEPMK
jgi:hypothetical protein